MMGEKADTIEAAEKQGRIVPGYTQDEVNNFWKSTDDKTLRDVKQATKSERMMQLSVTVRDRVAETEKQYIDNGSSRAELENLFQRYLDETARKVDNDKNSTSKRRRAGRHTTLFLNKFQDYVNAYSGIVQVMNGAGPGYGDAAYGALSLFLVVAVNRQKTEDVIQKMLVRLQAEYCRIETLKEVHASSQMKKYVAEVYRLGIEFLYEAVRFYSIGSVRRFFYILVHPPSIELDNKVSEIHDAIDEMRREREALDSLRMDRVEQKLGDVEESVNALRNRNDNDRLDTLRTLMKIDLHETDISLDSYEALLDERFVGIPRMPPFDVETHLFRDPLFQAWVDAPSPALMILYGSTTAPDQTELSWLSPAAVRLVNDLKEVIHVDDPTVAFQFCRTSDVYGDEAKQISPCTVLSSILYQFLRSEYGRTILRNENAYTRLKGRIEEMETIPPKRVTERLEKLHTMLGSVLRDMSTDNVLIVIDRADHVQGNLDRFLDPLLSLMEKAECKLKVFVTCRVRYSFNDAAIKERLGKGKYYSLEMDQWQG